jgi:hypothetical protein
MTDDPWAVLNGLPYVPANPIPTRPADLNGFDAFILAEAIAKRDHRDRDEVMAEVVALIEADRAALDAEQPPPADAGAAHARAAPLQGNED